MPLNEHRIDEGTAGYVEGEKGCYCPLDILTQEISSTKTGNVYIPIRKISNGNFSTVYVAFDQTNKQYCAMKICKHDLQYDRFFVEECEILERITNQLKDVQDDGKCIQIYEWFFYKYTAFTDDGTEKEYQHCCIITELLGHSILKLIDRYRYKLHMYVGVPIPVVKTITKSILLQLKHLHEAGYMHTDIKPENIVLKYFLPEIEYDANYKIPDLLFGRQSRHLFDSKLCTPAIKIVKQDIDNLENSDYSEVKGYILSLGKSRGYTSADECYQKLIIQENYKNLMKQFIEYNQINEVDAQHAYKIQGINIFNVQNLMREAEKIFRLVTLADNDWDNLQSIYISAAFNNNIDISDLQSQLTESVVSSPEDQVFKQKMSQVVTENHKLVQNAVIQQDILEFISARCGLKQLIKNSPKQETYKYKLIEQSQINSENTSITSDMGIQINISRVKPLTVDLKSIYAEKLYFNETEPHTIKQLACSGLHSRFALLRYMQDNGLGYQQYKLPKIYHMDQLKCFGLTRDMRAAYPVMINYFRKDSLIPFCEEMFKTRIIDLGNAESIAEKHTGEVQTRNYRAPEVICGCTHNEKIDIFSVGCIIFELLTGSILFASNHEDSDVQKNIKQLHYMTELLGGAGLSELIENGCSQKKSFLKSMEKQIYSKLRIPMSTILVQRFNMSKKEAQEVQDFLEQLLCIDPNKRVSAEQALKHPWLADVGQGEFLIQAGAKDSR